MTIYLLPGVGCDKRLFSRIELPGHEVKVLEWPPFSKGCTLAELAADMRAGVDATQPHILAGVSMGGMVAQELAALTKPTHVVIISSWKGPQEMPMPIRMMRGKHPERMLTPALFKHTLPLVRWQMGVETPEDVALLDALVQAHPLDQLKIQINACLSWEGPAVPVQHLTHIHGDKDRLMPLAPIVDAEVVHGGTHFMVYSMAAEVGAALRRALDQRP